MATKKKFAFCATVKCRRTLTVEEVADFFQTRTAIDVIEAMSEKAATRVFHQRHTVRAFGKLKNKYVIVQNGEL